MRSPPPALLAALLIVPLATATLRAEEPPAGEGAAPGEVAPADPGLGARIHHWIESLGSPDFETRERASRALIEAGEAARPALERAMEESENMEARWRADQILRRLDRVGEREVRSPAGEAPRGAREGRGRRAGAPAGRSGGVEVHPGMEEEFLRRLSPLDRFHREFDEALRRMGLGGPERVEAPGLVFMVEGFGLLTRARLEVAREGREPEVHVGRSLEDILARRPELKQHAGMAELERAWEARQRQGASSPFGPAFPPRVFPFGPGGGPGGASGGISPGLSVTTNSSTVEIRPEGDRIRVRLTEVDADGNRTVVEAEGATLDEIKEQHPELRDRLGGFTFDVRGGPGPFGRRDARPPPAPTTPTPPQPISERKVFGVVISEPEEALAAHLGLGEREGAVVADVLVGSRAHELGVEPLDVIVAIDGTRVRGSRGQVAEALRRAAQNPTMTLEVIRRGDRLTLPVR